MGLASQFPEINLLITRGVGPLFAAYCFFLFIQKPVRLPPELYLYGAFVLWCLSGLWVTTDFYAYWNYLKLIAQIEILFLCIVVIVARTGDVRHIFLALIWIAILLILIMLFSQKVLLELEYNESYRLSSVGLNPNGVGFMFLSGVMGLAFFWFKYKSILIRYLFIVIMAIFSIGIIYTASRKSFLVLLLFISLWLYFYYIKETLKRPVLIVPIVLTAFLLLQFYDYVSDYTLLGKRLHQYNSVQEMTEENVRFLMMKEGWEFFKRSPIIGIGLAHFKIYSVTGGYAHSDYFEVLSTTGIGGTLLYFSIYVVLWRRLRRLLHKLSDPRIRYEINLFRVILICILSLGFGGPIFIDIMNLSTIFGIISYTYNIEQRITELRKDDFYHINAFNKRKLIKSSI